MDNRYSISSLLHDYIDIFRGIQREQSNSIITYINAQREMNTAFSNLLLRYLEIERQSRNLANPPINNPFGRTTGRIPPPPVFNFGNSDSDSTFRNNTTSRLNRAPSQSPINNTSYNFSWPSNNTTSTDIFPRNTRNTSSTGRNRSSLLPRETSIRPRRIRTRTRTTTTTIPRDVFQNFINNTLNMGNVPQPLSDIDISTNTTNMIYGDISETTNQTICPFTQENFLNSDEISRINPCGHIFTRSHLNRYLTNFDYRCPVCRRSLRRENDVENPSVNRQPLIDFSSNTILPNTSNNQETRDIINNAVESVTSALMNNITNQINNDPSSNTFIAEYSFLLPGFSNTTNTTNTTDTPLASQHLQDYLGINRSLSNSITQTPLPPLPEESDSDIPELIEGFSDDDL